MSAQRTDPSATALLDLIAGHRVSATIHAAARLGIADLLFEAPRTVPELAQQTNTHEPSLLRLMRALVALGICHQEKAGAFRLTATGNYLAAQSEHSMKTWVLMESEMLRPGWSELAESIRTGKTAGQLAGLGKERFEILAATANAGLFNEAMVSMTRLVVPAILDAYDFSGISKLMDVGGGFAQLMSAILTKYPAMSGVVFDLPHCAEGARKNLSAAGVADRCEFSVGNFFETVPAGADAIVMKSIVHDWNDDRCVRLLLNCHRVLAPGARLMLIERVMPERIKAGAVDVSFVLDDLNMLRGPGGSERTSEEFRILLSKSGFIMRRVVPTGRYAVIEGVVE